MAIYTTSPSSRRAWIEMAFGLTRRRAALVALLAEGVDRNISLMVMRLLSFGRPPHGGRR